MPLEPALGRVLLVGAGPGPADLMTVRAMRTVQAAEALLYDALVSDEVVALAPRGCIRIQTGKRAGRASMKQTTINRLMLRLARRGLKVVRLKGGDPSVFGRSGEEAAFLESHGIAVEVIPGVTAASAAAAQFGVPLTHRRLARRLTIATARIEDGSVCDGFAATAADPEATLALYMGRDSFASVAEQLMASGRDPSTPVLAVENAGYAYARSVSGRLLEIGDRLSSERSAAPMVILVGDVAGMARKAGAEAMLQRSACG